MITNCQWKYKNSNLLSKIKIFADFPYSTQQSNVIIFYIYTFGNTLNSYKILYLSLIKFDIISHLFRIIKHLFAISRQVVNCISFSFLFSLFYISFSDLGLRKSSHLKKIYAHFIN